MTSSFPYVRDWINKHPFRNEPNAKLICNLNNGKSIKPDAIWQVLYRLRSKITRLVESGSITDEQRKQKLEYLLGTSPRSFQSASVSAVLVDFYSKLEMPKKVDELHQPLTITLRELRSKDKFLTNLGKHILNELECIYEYNKLPSLV